MQGYGQPQLGGGDLPVYRGLAGAASVALPGYRPGSGDMYGRGREAKALEEAIILTTPGPETGPEESVSHSDTHRRSQRKRDLPYNRRRRTKKKINWAEFP